MLVCGPSELSLLPMSLKSDDVNIFYSECSSQSNYFNIVILPNGSLFISNRFLEEVLDIGGVEGLTFVIIHEIAHLVKKDVKKNLK